MSDLLTDTLIGGSALMFAASAGFVGITVYQNYFSSFVNELRDESAGGMKGIGSVTIRKLGALNRRLMWPGYESKMRRKLIKGGEPQAFKPEDIMALQEISATVGLLAGLILMNAVNENLAWSLVLAAFGLWYPLIWVNDQVKKRHLQISRALPYSLDLLTLSVEAGLDFTGALAKVVEKGKAGPLREELQIVLKQLKMGKTREEALKAMILRVDLPALTTFVTALIQADKMGTSLGKVLRIQSTQLRIDRTQRAEKLAGEAPVKMLFPLIACIFPTVFMVLFGPIVFQFMFGDVGG
ncbi:type II secretion system F family protein [Vitiosangium sp. GDMCC 1.1324]|uniref:type II secretion system F family protein n=1 Tax=Vitiosangium sp. (strain GDMCC 1.1324) TaxID=2138576 RepID=UPI000D3D8D95|nr:type II secretion system F family protein [Vitiosangium sp. GDMCC 1.1324]PTL76139.1 secretion system protein F [Vitiosangium sp. GDMCC 1.1324]